MMRSVLAVVGIFCLAASPASAQMPNYWLATPPSVVSRPLAPPPQIPDVPFAPARNVRLLAKIPLDKNFKLLGPWPPLWLGSNEVALLGTRHGQLTLLAWYGEHFSQTRVIADPKVAGGGRILDMAVSRDGKRLAIAAAKDNHELEIRLRDTQGNAPAAVVASAEGPCDRAGIAWLDADTLAVGAESVQAPAPPSAESGDPPQAPADGAQPPMEFTHTLHIMKVGAQKASENLELACLPQIDPTRLSWSPDGRYAIGPSNDQRQWFLIDRTKGNCDPLKLGAIIPAGFIEWDNTSRRFLFTATPIAAANAAHMGVMEYSLASHRARLLASPASIAVYADEGRVAVLGSSRLNAAIVSSRPGLLVPAEIAWINAARAQVTMVPTGFGTTAAGLLDASLRYAPKKRMLAASFAAPGPKGAFPVLLYASGPSQTGGVLGTGQAKSRMLPSWSPDGDRIAVVAGLPEHPTLAIVASP
jgi:Lipoprotein LpqB beta-propeller domain/WD40-like Beta Propeller Repeat